MRERGAGREKTTLCAQSEGNLIQLNRFESSYQPSDVLSLEFNLWRINGKAKRVRSKKSTPFRQVILLLGLVIVRCNFMDGGEAFQIQDYDDDC